MPEAAIDRFGEPRRRFRERRRIRLGHERAHLGIAEIGIEQLIEVMAFNDARRGGECAKIIDRPAALEGALVAVAHLT